VVAVVLVRDLVLVVAVVVVVVVVLVVAVVIVVESYGRLDCETQVTKI
jgi:hypothetical protein